MGTYLVATAAYSAGLLSVQVWVYLAFGWVVLAILTYALSESSVIPQEARGRSVLVGGLAALIVATLAIGFDLNHIAADVYHKQGTGLDGDQRFAESVHSFAQALALAPDQDYYALYLGRSLLDVAMRAPIQQRTFDRTPALPDILQADPAAVAQYSRADAFDAAEVSLQRARELAPLDPDHVANLARLYRYWGQSTDPTKFQLALQFSAIATQLSPHSVQLFSEWAVLLLAQDDLVNAFQKASVAVQLDPRYAASHVVLGDIYLARMDADAGIAEHSLALGLDPTSLADGDFDRRVSKYVELGRGALLVGAYQRLLARDSSRTIRLAYAYVLSKTDRLRLAIEQYEVLVQGDPADWLSQRNLAVAYSQSGNQTRARAAANAALRVAPPSQRPSIESIISALGPG
jgi:tetratricopeptide (TPR) repeat protein